MSSGEYDDARPGPIKPIEGPIYAVSYDELARIYDDAKTLARRVSEKLLCEAKSGESMEALCVSYAPNDAESGAQPPAPPDDLDYLSILNLFRSPQSQETLTRGMTALLQRPDQGRIDQWTCDLAAQGIRIEERAALDLSRPEHVDRLCKQLFMLPEKDVWKEVEQKRFELGVLAESTKLQLEPLIILAKMNVNLGWCLEGSRSWRPLIESL